MRTVDVLVVGMGPGGASAAAEAAAAGRSVLAVERNRRLGEPVQCAEFIPNPMGRYARPEGVLQQRVTGMKTMLPSGAVEASEFPGLMIDRAAFDRAIAQRAIEAGAEVLTGTRLVALDAERRVATCADKTQRFDVAYELIIAGDGPHSPVAELLGLPPLEIVYTRQYTVPLLRPYADTDIWLSDDYPGGYGWLFPKGAVANLGLGADREFEDNLKRPLEALHEALVAQGLLGREILARTGGAIPVGGPREHLVEGCALFVGDAAGLTHPITGAGIHAAVVSGEAAGRAAAAYLAGDENALEDFEEDVLDQFEPGLRRAVERRASLKNCWRTPAAAEDANMRRGWIAFDEYFAA
ncbi:NAD(P)/FAD-dependent oxidoreductase [Ectothiorhodospiraceae bacterium 2226]|nr:NAD(P)/FAD-dependent oxidoreductase [Ectothiorhodospiraceae bacterium 2226]